MEKTSTAAKCQKKKSARAKRAKLLFFIVKCANLWRSLCPRRHGCLSSLLEALEDKIRIPPRAYVISSIFTLPRFDSNRLDHLDLYNVHQRDHCQQFACWNLDFFAKTELWEHEFIIGNMQVLYIWSTANLRMQIALQVFDKRPQG